MFTKILVALDHTSAAPVLFQKALELAQPLGAELLLLSVLTPDGDGNLPLPDYSGLTSYAVGTSSNLWDMYLKSYQEYETAATERLRNFVEQASTVGVSGQFKQVNGDVGRIICEQAKSWAADLVIVGSRGRKGLSEMLLGSVSNYVMHHATCSVLVVHDSQESKPEATIAEKEAVEQS